MARKAENFGEGYVSLFAFFLFLVIIFVFVVIILFGLVLNSQPLPVVLYPKTDLLTQCLKIIEKVASTIASEASYVYILSGQKLIKNGKNGPFWRVFENLKLAVKQSCQLM